MNQTVRFVYKLYDSDSQVLYVGMSQDVYKRVRMHAHTFPYWKDVRTIEVYVYPWDVAQVAETWFIRVDNPLHNGMRPSASALVKHPGSPILEFLFDAPESEIQRQQDRWFRQSMRDAGLDEIHGSYLTPWAPEWAYQDQVTT